MTRTLELEEQTLANGRYRVHYTSGPRLLEVQVADAQIVVFRRISHKFYRDFVKCHEPDMYYETKLLKHHHINLNTVSLMTGEIGATSARQIALPCGVHVIAMTYDEQLSVLQLTMSDHKHQVYSDVTENEAMGITLTRKVDTYYDAHFSDRKPLTF
ncbi:hypothetical protein [Levilactobacillus fujinensis]|uniref:Uncharacterized protein n=1 Tax=Levilactobacillus fujinensis TaxID=2486024 RepID=A0ABW1TDA3_9LACO|nr:hypothetical protein [Levilactobacillus fujinensis]